MMENSEKGNKMSRRRFFQGMLASGAAVATSTIVPEAVYAQENAESQESKIPSAEQMEGMVSTAIQEAHKDNKQLLSESFVRRDELLKKLSAGQRRFADSKSYSAIMDKLEEKRERVESLVREDSPIVNRIKEWESTAKRLYDEWNEVGRKTNVEALLLRYIKLIEDILLVANDIEHAKEILRRDGVSVEPIHVAIVAYAKEKDLWTRFVASLPE